MHTNKHTSILSALFIAWWFCSLCVIYMMSCDCRSKICMSIRHSILSSPSMKVLFILTRTVIILSKSDVVYFLVWSLMTTFTYMIWTWQFKKLSLSPCLYTQTANCDSLDDMFHFRSTWPSNRIFNDISLKRFKGFYSLFSKLFLKERWSKCTCPCFSWLCVCLICVIDV